MKNKLILTAVKKLKRWISPTLNLGSKKILVVSSTALGDTLWATPTLFSLRKSFPEAIIAVLTSPIGEQVLRHNPNIDQIFTLQEPMLPRCFQLWRMLNKEQFTDIVILHASQRLMLPLCALLGAQRIIGTSGINKGLDALLTDPVPATGDHEIVRRLKLIEKLGAKTHTEELSFFLQPEEKISWTKHSLRVAIHPGSKDGFKRWPAEHFIQVGKELRKQGAEICLTGTVQEIPLLEQIRDAIPDAVICNPTWTLRQFAAHLEHCDLLISNDTGPVHLACALHVPVLAIYSPTNPALCGPHLAKRALALAKPPTCKPCLKRQCQRPFCLLQIGPDEVISAANKMLLNGH